MSTPSRLGSPRMSHLTGDSATGDPRTDAVRTARQNDGDTRPEYQSGAVRVCQKAELLGENIRRLQVRSEQNVRIARDVRVNAFRLGSVLADSVVKRERAIDQSAFDLPAVGHFAKGRGVERGRHLRVDRFDRGEDRDLGLVATEGYGQVNRV